MPSLSIFFHPRFQRRPSASSSSSISPPWETSRNSLPQSLARLPPELFSLMSWLANTSSVCAAPLPYSRIGSATNKLPCMLCGTSRFREQVRSGFSFTAYHSRAPAYVCLSLRSISFSTRHRMTWTSTSSCMSRLRLRPPHQWHIRITSYFQMESRPTDHGNPHCGHD